MKKWLLLSLLLVSSLGFASSELKTFKTDGCTMFFDGTIRRPGVWRPCCFEHDLRYWFGGSKKQQKKSDLILKNCVRRKAGSFWANLMYYGIRAGHFSPIKNKYKWGWGWETPIGFRSLNSEEKKYIVKQLNQMDLDPEFLKRFLKQYELQR